MSVLTPEQEKIIREAKVDVRSHTDRQWALEKKVCIMELVNVVQGRAVHDSPPCVSKLVRNCAIQVNDACKSDYNRARLKKLVPTFIHTAPTITKRSYTMTAEKNPKYRAAEKKRGDLLQTRLEKTVRKAEGLRDDEKVDDYMELEYIAYLPFNQQLRLLEELADIARFD